MAEISAGPAVPRVTQDAAIAAKTPEQREALWAQMKMQYIAEYKALGYSEEEILAKVEERLEELREEIAGGPPPVALTVTGLNPTMAEIGAPDLVLSVYGTGFTPESVLLWNGSPEPFVYVSPEELTTVVKPSLASGPWTIPVTVEGAAETVEFTFVEPPA